MTAVVEELNEVAVFLLLEFLLLKVTSDGGWEPPSKKKKKITMEERERKKKQISHTLLPLSFFPLPPSPGPFVKSSKHQRLDLSLQKRLAFEPCPSLSPEAERHTFKEAGP